MVDMRNAYKILSGKPEGKNHWHRWQDTIKVGHKEVWCENVELLVRLWIKTSAGPL